ncbi:hypothetical protein K2Q00_01825 [Patescibacteria group bacterium]|nr:hypothetical protein [Patescibacteria group bacterium]
MPSIIKFKDFVSISGDTLTIDPGLKPKPDIGVQVLFRFAFRGDVIRHLVGDASLLNNWDTEPTPYDAEMESYLSGLCNLGDSRGEQINLERLSLGDTVVELRLDRLAKILFGHEENWMEGIDNVFIRAAMKTLVETHTVTAAIDRTADGVGIMVVFKKLNEVKFSFLFEIDRAAAEKIFMFQDVESVV